MTSSQVVILCIMIGYLVLNVTIGMIMSKRQERASTMSQEKKYFIGSRGMNGLVLAMTTMATYTSVSSFISGPGAAGMTYGYAQDGGLNYYDNASQLYKNYLFNSGNLDVPFKDITYPHPLLF